MKPDQLFISVGETGAYFTLRHSYEYIVVLSGEVHREIRSSHLFNLSQDAEEAVKKATEYAEMQGLDLVETAPDRLAKDLRDIKKATAEEMEARREEYRRKNEEREEERRKQDEERLREMRATLAEGVFPFGPWEGVPFRDADAGYVNWWMTKCPEFEEGSLVREVAEAVLAQCADRKLPVADPNMLVGEPKKRLDFEVVVTRNAHFDRPSFSGYGTDRTYVTTMVTEKGACLVCFSGSFSKPVGTRLKIRATVKEHSEYNGQAQTIVQRVAVSEEQEVSS